MDANGLHFAMLSEGEHWHLGGDPPGLAYNAQRRTLRLTGRRTLPPQAADPRPLAEPLLEATPGAVDAFGSRAFATDGFAAVEVVSDDLPDSVPLFFGGPGDITDVAAGADGTLYVAFDGQLVLVDPHERWDNAFLTEIDAWRIAPLPATPDGASGGAWVLDRNGRVLERMRGLPLPPRGDLYSPETWRPDPENPDPPRYDRTLDLENDLGLAASELPAGLVASPSGRVALLTWETADGGAAARLRIGSPKGQFGAPLDLLHSPGEALQAPFSLVWLGNERIALLVPDLGEAAVYDIPQDAATSGTGAAARNLLPAGDLYPLPNHDGRPFFRPAPVTGDDAPLPAYPVFVEDGGPGDAAPLNRLSQPSYARFGEALSGALTAGGSTEPRGLDSGQGGAVWHRLYLEAHLPTHTAVRVFLAASDEGEAPADPGEWFEHRFGAAVTLPQDPRVPRGAWVSQPSEIPSHEGLLPCPRERGRAGLFTALVQRAGRKVTALRGRYLWVRLEMVGDGRATPEVAALRAYSSRFSYRDRYLPDLYGEQLFGPDADAALAVDESTTPADFLERFLGNFEGVLTGMEDRIADAHLLTAPETVPTDSLPWLGNWIGVTFEPGLTEERRRAMLLAAPELQRWHGTRRGLALALDVATGGAVRGGEIVVLEDFRLRRTFATVLGADLANEDDPLLAGLTVSGNSFVGDTLLLGSEHRKEFLALFSDELPKTTAEEEAVEEFFERLAYRATILVHQEVEPQDLGLVRRVAETAAPAHVEIRVVRASQPFVVGLSALIGVDSYLVDAAPPSPVRVGRSHLGGGDLLSRPPSLDPRLGGGNFIRQDIPPEEEFL